MKLTNVNNIMAPLAALLAKDEYTRDADISATSLLDSPRVFQLTERHGGQAIKDVSENLWSCMGTVIHNALEQAVLESESLSGQYIVEERRFVRMADWIISGSTDAYDRDNGIVYDYKIVNANSIIRQQKKWEQQLNIYALLHTEAALTVNKVVNVAICKGWSRFQTKKEGYPEREITEIEQPLWTSEQQIGFLAERVMVHKEASVLGDYDLPDCTPEERWASPDTFAVKLIAKKAGRAIRVFDSKDQANEFIRAKASTMPESPGCTPDRYCIETRKGTSLRCEKYCNCAPFCNQYQRIVAGE